MYDLVRAPAETEKKIAVVNFEEIGSAENVEFVIGVGVAKRQQELGEKVDQAVQDALAKKGYAGVSPDEVFSDCLLEHSKFNASDLLGSAFPNYARSSRMFIPIFRYLKSAGIASRKELNDSKLEGAKKIVGKLWNADYTSTPYAGRYKASFARLSTADIIQKSSSPTEAALMLAFQPASEVDVALLCDFLRTNGDAISAEPYKTAYRKLVCRYDRLAFGF